MTHTDWPKEMVGRTGRVSESRRFISSNIEPRLRLWFLFQRRLFQTIHTEMDLRLCEIVQHAWEDGDSRNILADARSGLMQFINALRGQHHGSQRLLPAWSKHELPMRADPLPISVLLAMVGTALEAQKLRIAMSLLIGLHALLRTCEIIHIQASHFTFPQQHGPVPLLLPHNASKTSQKQFQSQTIGPCVYLCCGTQAPAR